METRIGLGRDLHALVSGRRFLLGGVEIPFDKGEDGHSDGDVLSHAIIDALLGAACLGDIGEFFPPSEAKWKNAASLELLKLSYRRVIDAGWHLVNIDCVVSVQQPKILPYRAAICESIEAALGEIDGGISKGRVFVKAKTGEGLGDIGNGRAVETMAVCLLNKDW
jgi:2-C-methyl-D-erythritol 2,4-cyclodiphosphate synthase